MAVKNATHPYYPRSLVIPHYKPNDKNAFELVGVFFGIVGVFIVATWWVSGRVKPRLSLPRRIVICWFVSCGLIHGILEGYFSFFHATLVGEMDFLAQMCKYIPKPYWVIKTNLTLSAEHQPQDKGRMGARLI